MIKLDKNIKPIVHRSPIFTYMFNTLSSAEAPAVKEVKQKRQKAPTDGLLTETVTENVDNENKTATNDELVVKMFRNLSESLKICNNREPINFFRFIIDPDSFGKSVENLFHASFLIKEGRAGIRVKKKEDIPEIWPVTDLERSHLQSDGDEDDGVRNQLEDPSSEP